MHSYRLRRFVAPLLALLFANYGIFAQDVQTKGGASNIEEHASEGEWIQLFNGKDLEGWIPKIRYHELGDNFANTFRVEDGLMKVRYDSEKYPEFKEKFGHIFYENHFPIIACESNIDLWETNVRKGQVGPFAIAA